MDFALFEKLRNYSPEKTHYLAYYLVSVPSYLNLLIQMIAVAIKSYNFLPVAWVTLVAVVAWVTFVAAVAACVGAIASLIVIHGFPRWMQWVYCFMALILVGITGFGILTGQDMTIVAYVISFVMMIMFHFSDPGLKRYFQLNDGKRVPLSVIEYNILKKEVVFKDREDDKHHAD